MKKSFSNAQKCHWHLFFKQVLKAGLIVLATLASLGCSESEPAKEITDAERCLGMPIANIQGVYPPTGRIPLGHTVIVIMFDEPPCNIRVTNQPNAQWLIHKWYMDDATTLFLEVEAPRTDGLVHVAVDWHSGGKVLRWVSHKF